MNETIENFEKEDKKRYLANLAQFIDQKDHRAFAGDIDIIEMVYVHTLGFLGGRCNQELNEIIFDVGRFVHILGNDYGYLFVQLPQGAGYGAFNRIKVLDFKVEDVDLFIINVAEPFLTQAKKLRYQEKADATTPTH